MQFSFSKCEGIIVVTMAFLFAVVLIACDESTPPPVVPPDEPPEITLFDADTTTIHEFESISFSILASDDNGIDSAVIDYGDGGRFKINHEGRKNLSAGLTREYGTTGFFTTTLTVYDTKGQSAQESILVMVFPPDTSLTPQSRLLPIVGH